MWVGYGGHSVQSTVMEDVNMWADYGGHVMISAVYNSDGKISTYG